MFQEWFASMHEILDEIAVQYPHATEEQRQELNEQMNMLQQLSIDCCEEWLIFEEKLAQWKEVMLMEDPDFEFSEELDSGLISEFYSGITAEHESELDAVICTDLFQKGEGYFTLLMYPEANRCFEMVVDEHPEFCLGRIYLAIGLLETGQLDEAYRQFTFAYSLANEARLKAIALHGMGCIQVQKNHLEKACEYFRMARDTDPSLSYYSLS